MSDDVSVGRPVRTEVEMSVKVGVDGNTLWR